MHIDTRRRRARRVVPAQRTGAGGVRAPSRPGRAGAGAAASRGQWAAWAFLPPVVIYLVVFYAYPLYRNLDLSLRDYTVRSFVHGNAPFVGLDNYIEGLPRPDLRAGAHAHRWSSPSSRSLFQFAIGLALAVFFHQQLPAVGHAAGAVPGAVAAAADRVGLDLVVDAQQRLRRRQLRRCTSFGVGPVNWLTSPHWALTSVIIANIWIGIPFNLVMLYSGLQNIPAELYEAASLDGAERLAAVLADHLPAAAAGLGDHAAARPRLHAQGVRHHLDHDQGRPGDSSTTFATWSYRLGFGIAAARSSARRPRSATC